MSEFQIYHFKKIDDTLNAEEKKMVQALSSHIKVSSQNAIVSYSYGDFKHKVEKVVVDFFDAMLYQTNWGQKKLIFKFPVESVNYDELYDYQIDGSDETGYITGIFVWKTPKYVLITIEYCDDDFQEWIEEGNHKLEQLIDLRNEIALGNYSCLYAFWLKLIALSEKNILLPPLPNGLKAKTQSCDNFIEYFEIEPELVKQAASFIDLSENINLEKNISSLTEKEKSDWLKRLLNSEKMLVVKFNKRLTEFVKTAPNSRLYFQEIKDKKFKK
jgi:hypothetical protein